MTQRQLYVLAFLDNELGEDQEEENEIIMPDSDEELEVSYIILVTWKRRIVVCTNIGNQQQLYCYSR